MTGDGTGDGTGLTAPGCCNAYIGFIIVSSFLRIMHGRNIIFSGVGISTGGPTCILVCAGEDDSEVRSDTADISERGEIANTDSAWEPAEAVSVRAAVDVFTYSPFLKKPHQMLPDASTSSPYPCAREFFQWPRYRIDPSG